MSTPTHGPISPRFALKTLGLAAACLITLAACERARVTPDAASANDRPHAAPSTPATHGESADGDPSTTTAPADDSPDQRSRPRTDAYATQRRAMVDQQIAARGIDDPDVLAAMRAVPRHWFVPERLRPLAYADRPLPIGHDQTISQPYIVAFMTAALDIDSNARVLEIGTGSGYQAAVLSEITPHVYTIEIVEPLGRRAIDTFKEKGYDTIAARIGDGYQGWPEFAPFDAIIVTCAPDHVPPKLVEQLAVGGRLCIPVGRDGGIQKLIRATKQDDETLNRKSLIPVRFVPMTGDARRRDHNDD